MKENCKILVTGGTGFIGQKLCKMLVAEGKNVTVLTRKIKQKECEKNLNFISNLDEVPFDFEIVINLSGSPIACRWNSKKKQEIYDSRIKITKKLVEKIQQSQIAPKLFISGSAIGYYGTSSSVVFHENSKPTEQNLFSQKLCLDWEEEAKKAENKARVVLLRTGIVLGRSGKNLGGILRKMFLPFYLGLGGKIGLGNQYLSWIHIDDVIGIIKYTIDHKEIFGAINLTADLSSQNPTTNEEFSKTLAQALNRPCFFNMPSFVAKLVYGEMAEELLLTGQNVVPQKILQSGYIFRHKSLKLAIEESLTL